jgi:hypothetical protein
VSLTASNPLGHPSSQAGWPDGALEQAVTLQRCLSIGDRDWHALKSQRCRRAAEQISAALVQLLAADDPRNALPGEGRQQAVALLENSLGWLTGELSDPGCPGHRR